MSQQKIILVAGPTAAGKSAFALDLARKSNGVIINADAMQVYVGLPILSAQPSAHDQQVVPHRLYGCVDPAEASSAGKWLAMATDAIRQVVHAGQTPILVGGTGLYFRALLGGLADIPPIPASVRDDAQKLYDEKGEDVFRRELAKIDAISAERLERNDRQRLIRAYEVAHHTGKPLSEWHEASSTMATSPEVKIEMPSSGGHLTLMPEFHLLMPPRDALYAACDQRFWDMVEGGALDEVRLFQGRQLPPHLPAMKTVGLRELAAFLDGTMTREDAIAKAQQATRNYAKRQMTWFRNQWKMVPHVGDGERNL